MKKLLVFTDVTDCDNGVIIILKAPFWNGQNFYPYFMNGSGKCEYKNADIIFFPDYDDLNLFKEEDNLWKPLQITVNDPDVDLRVIFHHKNRQINSYILESDNFDSIPEKLNAVNYIEQSHISGSVFCDELRQIEIAINTKNLIEYKKQLERIYARFHNPELEAKLNILHACLTPEGTREVKQALENNENKFLDAFKDTKVNSKKVYHLVNELSISSNESDCLEPIYIEKLKELRILLLEV